MIENRRFGNLPAHLVLIVGVLTVAFPVYLAIIGSTHTAETIANGQLPLWPGDQLVENYRRALFVGTTRTTRARVIIAISGSPSIRRRRRVR